MKQMGVFFVVSLIAAFATSSVAQLPEYITFEVSGVLDDTQASRDLVADLGGEGLEWSLRGFGNRVFGDTYFVESPYIGSFAGLRIQDPGSLVAIGFLSTNPNGSAGNDNSGLGGFQPFPRDPVDFNLLSSIVTADGTTRVFDFAGFATIAPRTLEYGVPVDESQLLQSEFELRTVFGDDVVTTGRISGFTVSIVPTPTGSGIFVIVGLVTVARRRRRKLDSAYLRPSR
ncbi:MAG: hypothetical protein AAGI53_03555 [Planctomycetota bacterium]